VAISTSSAIQTYVNDFPDDEFKVEENVTREQVAEMLAVTLELMEYLYGSR